MVETDMDPQEAAEYARGDRETADMGGGDMMGNTDMGPTTSSDSIVKRLFDGSLSGPPIRELEEEYGLDKWMSLLTRGGLRVAPGDGQGVPPIVEMIAGSVLGLKSFQESQSESADEQLEGQTPEPPQGP